MPFCKHHPSVDRIVLALASMREGDAETASELLTAALEDEGLDDALEDLSENNDMAFGVDGEGDDDDDMDEEPDDDDDDMDEEPDDDEDDTALAGMSRMRRNASNRKGAVSAALRRAKRALASAEDGDTFEDENDDGDQLGADIDDETLDDEDDSITEAVNAALRRTKSKATASAKAPAKRKASRSTASARVRGNSRGLL